MMSCNVILVLMFCKRKWFIFIQDAIMIFGFGNIALWYICRFME